MTTPKSKLSSGGQPDEPDTSATPADPAAARDERTEPPRRRAPPPLPASARPHAALGQSSTASHATSHIAGQLATPAAEETPLAGPTSQPAHPDRSLDPAIFPGQSGALEPDDTERSSAGFSALFEHTSLREWIRRIESTHCDAVVTVAGELGHGQLWCVAGNVVDAEWQSLDAQLVVTGEDAAHQILTLRGGDVSVAFVPVDRPRVIALSTRQLLGKAARRSDRPSLSATASELESTGVRPSGVVPVQRTTLFFRPTTTGIFTNTETRLTPLPERKPQLTTYLAGLLALVTLGAVAVGIRQLALNSSSESSRSEQVRVGTLKAAGALPAVQIEVIPAEAEIWLDSKRLGTGRVSQSAIRDGLVHQLRFIAPGYAPKSVFFRDLPAAGKVRLEPIAAAELTLKNAAASLSPPLDEPSSAAPSASPAAVPAAVRTAAPASAGPSPAASSPTNAPSRAAGLTSAQNPVVSDSRQAERAPDAPASEAKSSAARRAVAPAPQPTPGKSPPPAPAKPQIQVIEVRTPRVQVID
jgi:uncharacterized protein DUF4388